MKPKKIEDTELYRVAKELGIIDDPKYKLDKLLTDKMEKDNK